MRRHLILRSIPLPWTRRDSAQGESSPLIPKAGSTREDPELGHAINECPQANDGQDNRPVRPLYMYSLMENVLKYYLLLSNLTFAVISLLILGLGIWGLVHKESFAQEKIGSIGTDPMLVFVILGSVLTMVCLSGCVGALSESCFLLKLFSATLLVLIAAQVLLAIVAYSLREQIGEHMRSWMLAAMVRYQDDLDLRFIMDEIQYNMQCCGADNYRDWEVNIYYNCSSPGLLACGVPPTCCVDPLENGQVWNSQCGVRARMLTEFNAQSVIFLGGCIGGILRWVEQHSCLIGTIGLVSLGVQIVSLSVTIQLVQRIQRRKINNIGC